MTGQEHDGAGAVAVRAAWGTYQQIADRLRARIASGELAPGAEVPSEADLGAEFGVARTTVRRALAVLEREGLVAVAPGRGRTVSGPGSPAPFPGESAAARIARDLAGQVAGGDLAPGDRLPSEHALAAEHGVSRGTARQALARLETAGLVEAAQGRGRYVRAADAASARREARCQDQ
nr:winged helix-turn-helix domain-containing protein [Nocardiopsis baichengensis]